MTKKQKLILGEILEDIFKYKAKYKCSTIEATEDWLNEGPADQYIIDELYELGFIE